MSIHRFSFRRALCAFSLLWVANLPLAHAQNTFFNIDFANSFGGDLTVDEVETLGLYFFRGTTDFTDDLIVTIVVTDLDNPSNEFTASASTSGGYLGVGLRL